MVDIHRLHCPITLTNAGKFALLIKKIQKRKSDFVVLREEGRKIYCVVQVAVPGVSYSFWIIAEGHPSAYVSKKKLLCN